MNTLEGIIEDVEKGELVSENNKLLVKINELETSLEGTSQALDRAEKKTVDLEKKVKYYEQQLSAMEKGVCDVCKVKDADYYEKQIADLEEQIEKMKCCDNCKHYRWLNGEDWCKDHYGQPMYDEECKDKWELKE